MDEERDIDTLTDAYSDVGDSGRSSSGLDQGSTNQPYGYSPGAGDIWADMSAQQLAQAHPNWESWTASPATSGAAAEYVASVRVKLMEGNHSNLAKCLVDPKEARALSAAQGITPDAGFWLIPPLRAPADVRLFSCGDRCVEAGTTIMIPEHKVGYPAAKGSIVTVRKGEFYGVGVLNTTVFDNHVRNGLTCCTKELVMLRSVKNQPTMKSSSLNSVQDLADAISSVSYPQQSNASPESVARKEKMLLGKPFGPAVLMAGPLRRPSPNGQMTSSGSLKKPPSQLYLQKTSSEKYLGTADALKSKKSNGWVRNSVTPRKE
ncbi:hypothetical protein CcCBS67573_g02938 [Chytriomyces confervae]|uniref:Uncharacterized protein n=1 Tax=Chytriomyces confervae TaxID=246404 RepID=A0A507FHU5_9FUNG|nr:hypothetical protein CcCBS67573_g02938 [Chytriomyces confervae]